MCGGIPDILNAYQVQKYSNNVVFCSLLQTLNYLSKYFELSSEKKYLFITDIYIFFRSSKVTDNDKYFHKAFVNNERKTRFLALVCRTDKVK